MISHTDRLLTQDNIINATKFNPEATVCNTSATLSVQGTSGLIY